MPVEGSPHAFYTSLGMFASLTVEQREARSRAGWSPITADSSARTFACTPRRKSACSIVRVAAIGLTALSLVLTGSAAATGSHGRNGAGNHSTTPEPSPNSDPTADPELPGALALGHDKCKRRKGLEPMLPWCTDPASGWMGSTTFRVRPDIPGPMGICASNSLPSSSGCQPAPSRGHESEFRCDIKRPDGGRRSRHSADCTRPG
jgi:hypothetical protein